MKHRFLIHKLNHTVLAVDVSAISLPDYIIEDTGHEQSVPSIRFTSWSHAEKYFSSLGATPKVLAGVSESFGKTGLAVLTLV
jgi:hypothetical protein